MTIANINTSTPPLSTSGSRQVWIDCLRGFTMLLVVLVHCENHLYMKAPAAISSFSSFYVSFMMPLFVFISGYFSYSPHLRLNAAELHYAIMRRMKMLLIPTAIFMVLFYFAYSLPKGHSFYHLLCDPYKGLGWFTLIIFECFAVAAPFVALLNSGLISRRAALLLMILIACLSLYVHSRLWGNTSDLGDWFNIITHPRVFELFFYFMAGIVARVALRVMRPPYVSLWVLVPMFAVSFGAIIWIAPMLKSYYFDWRIVPFILMSIFALFFLFARLRDVLTEENRIGRFLSYLGRNTLQVYLMHLMIVNVFDFAVIQDLYDWGSLNLDAMLPFNIALTIGIAALCLYLDKLFARTRVYRYVYPKLPSRRSLTTAATA
ncbi:MAG: acyltransferase [Candidatus Amulumruptor caecigallinarius]|nr:acyltransferase [Candidatus Amulumruptor caecigallinarius]MCM1396658.1 acyltransferase [Candidatus Amulumruptor caecigallinarius]MCM1453284.1 acyltransferase [bacterium]